MSWSAAGPYRYPTGPDVEPPKQCRWRGLWETEIRPTTPTRAVCPRGLPPTEDQLVVPLVPNDDVGLL